MRHMKILLGAALVCGVLAAGGAAFTDSNTQPATHTLGYGTTTVSGATVVSLNYNLDATGANINTITLVLSGNTSSSNVSIAFNTGNSTACTLVDYNTTNVGDTTYTCDNSGSNFVEPTSSLTATHVIVN